MTVRNEGAGNGKVFLISPEAPVPPDPFLPPGRWVRTQALQRTTSATSSRSSCCVHPSVVVMSGS